MCYSYRICKKIFFFLYLSLFDDTRYIWRSISGNKYVLNFSFCSSYIIHIYLLYKVKLYWRRKEFIWHYNFLEIIDIWTFNTNCKMRIFKRVVMFSMYVLINLTVDVFPVCTKACFSSGCIIIVWIL